LGLRCLLYLGVGFSGGGVGVGMAELGEGLPLPIEDGGAGVTAMDIEAVTKDQGLAGSEGTRGIEGEGGAHPTVIAHMEDGGMAGVLGVVEEREAFDGGGGDGPRVVHPTRAFPEHSGFIEATLRAADGAAAVVDADGFGNPDTQQAEGRLAERHAGLGCLELEVNQQQPLGVAEVDHGGLTSFPQEDLAGISQPSVEGRDGGCPGAVDELLEALMHDAALAAIVPETGAVDVGMGDPDRVMVAVRLRVMRMSESGEGPAGRADDGEDKGPSQVRTEMVAC